ncbi:hypothetical protein SAMN05421789_11050 [Kaistella chaponensis]|uniref:Uncharacterized protein n=1 Tax=Kaistella chaponensis TaxID=713588 RepID=A0A1N7MUG0_9FLAO|nr:hypothetical protein [Kaistella chaponensis]SIS89720.1 hypothetical protein SAMN05421789_11050 [Kaistella chaponensis]
MELRLEFDHLFGNEKKEEVIFYLKKLSKKTNEEIIGFLTTPNLPDYHNFFSNPAIQLDINRRIAQYLFGNKIEGNVKLVSREGSLQLAETILVNKIELIENNQNPEDRDSEELNLFKAILIINGNINRNVNLTLDTTEDNIEKIAEVFVALKFSSADLGLYEDVSFELLKLAFATSYRFQSLIAFLSSKEELRYLLDDFCIYFKQDNSAALQKQVDYLIVQILRFRENNSYKYKVEDEEAAKFLDSLCGDEIITEADFLRLRNHPLYKIDDFTYAIIDPFFVLDKFTKSLKFSLKESYNRQNNYKDSDGRFFSWFNKEFSEEFLMKNLLDNIFYKKYFIKANTNVGEESKPDYYVRYDKNIFLFEYKDVLIRKETKVSGNIELILGVLKKKFLFDPADHRAVGIGQLINHIKAIAADNFPFDDKINLEKNNNVYPILLLSDRLLEIPGINYILNKWFRENLDQGGSKLKVKNLCVLDIDTLIFLEQYLKRKDGNFRNLLDEHVAKMDKKAKGYGDTLQKFQVNIIKQLSKQLSPFTGRISKDYFDPKNFVARFEYLVNNNTNS